jgi:hypothetical protein
MWHIPPKSAGHRTCDTWWSFHLKCGEDHDGCRQIHSAPKRSLSSHLGLSDLVHAGHCVLDDQHFKFFNDILPTTILVGLGEPNNSHYVFPVTYRDAKAFER